MLPISGFLFDIDGTLIDSNDAHAKAWDQTFRENGIEVPFAEIRASIGMGGDHLLPKLASVEKDSSIGKQMEQRRGEIFRETYLPTLNSFSKSRELLQTLRAKAYVVGVATSASAKDLKSLLKQTGLEDSFDTKTNSSDVRRSKPEPDVIEAALEKIAVDSRRTAMVGDTPYDIEAATRAGVRTIGLTCGGWSKQALKEAGAWKVYADPAELLDAVITGRALS